ncbi:hypothetical protein X777_03895 [Ooceraea biroi]|uniref:Uncharacterized protein n=1 Tax=Ooceraea biroi TaxID=2015173 RepID=A0A026WJ97_OOCBI|nr:hypothetical protein X777_03895 [Ooceraea biroi]
MRVTRGERDWRISFLLFSRLPSKYRAQNERRSRLSLASVALHITAIEKRNFAEKIGWEGYANSSKLSEQEQRNFALLQSQRSMRIRRSIESMEEEKIPKRNCYNSACGWAVYDPVTRNIEYFMKNACTCPDESYKCVRTGDDLSASAYVYRCRQNTTADDIESPEDAN